jgi:hypothetical protein
VQVSSQKFYSDIAKEKLKESDRMDAGTVEYLGFLGTLLLYCGAFVTM